ncbi:Isochorismatase-like protein [Mycena belliarum]|uniref:nicotinamidase n=1 Tax=Mycena belliarum TaxID=1033014 RepID=A0AAD6U802_9AGAR|nr:Isochorismatase-like protein [Mycena belliae]
MDSKVALIIVDLQEDFCPPNGSLAVPGGREIVPVINRLLASPLFDVTVATKDWHPADHISFASNHPAPDNLPFESFAKVVNPYNPSESYETRLWPVHCVQGTTGAQLVPDLDVAKVNHIIEKGQDKRVEMYSAFWDPFVNPRVAESGLRGYLREHGVGTVYVVGLAMDYCVKATAEDAASEGLETYVIKDGTKAVDPDEGWKKAKAEMESKGVRFVGIYDIQI